MSLRPCRFQGRALLGAAADAGQRLVSRSGPNKAVQFVMRVSRGTYGVSSGVSSPEETTAMGHREAVGCKRPRKPIAEGLALLHCIDSLPQSPDRLLQHPAAVPWWAG